MSSISVIIPVYQAERFVEKAVESACDQEEVGEVILVEDCSSDSSLEKCKSLVNLLPLKVKLFRHTDGQNHGAGASRNLGIKKAKGEFIAFLDADDYYLPGRFKKDLKILLNNPDHDGVYNALGVHVHDEDERERITFDLTTVKYHIPPENLFEEMAPLGSAGYFSCDTLTVRRTIFDKVAFFDSDLEVMQDTHMWIKMAAKATLVAGVIDQPVAMRGVHAGNRVKDLDKFEYYRPLLFSSLFKWAEKNKISNARKTRLWDCLYRAKEATVYNQQVNFFRKKKALFFFLLTYGITYPYLFKHQTYRLSFARLLK